MSIVWRPILDPLLVWSVVLTVAMVTLASYRKACAGRQSLGALMFMARLTLLAAVGVVLTGPAELVQSDEQQSQPCLRILLDHSASMSVADMSGRPRLAYLLERWLTADQLSRLKRHADVQVLAFDEEVRPMASAPTPAEAATGRGTQLVQSVTDTLLRMPWPASAATDGSALLVMSDGRDSDGQSPARAIAAARSRGLPVHTVHVGSEDERPDLSISASLTRPVVVLGNEAHIAVEVFHAGVKPMLAVVRIRHNDTTITHHVQLSAIQPSVLRVPVTPMSAGMHMYEVAVDAVAGEAEMSNNQQTVFLRATDTPTRVLLLEGQPHWDTKFIAQALRSDDQIALTQVTQIALRRRQYVLPGNDGDGAIELPRTAGDWAGYDAVILGRSVQRLLDEESARGLVAYVTDGGGRLIFARGRAYDPSTPEGRPLAPVFATLEPVRWGDWGGRQSPAQRLTLTGAGLINPAIAAIAPASHLPELFQQLPIVDAIPPIDRPAAAAVTLAAAGDERQPALLTMRHGRGAVMMMLAEGSWRWSLHGSGERDTAAAGLHKAMWTNLVRWLVMDSEFLPGERLSLSVEPQSVRLGEPALVRMATRMVGSLGASPQVEVTDTGGQVTPITLRPAEGAHSVYIGEFTPNAVGVHHARFQHDTDADAKAHAMFSAFDVNLEKMNSAPDKSLMRELAQQTGGIALSADKPEGPAELFDLLERQRSMAMTGADMRYVWDTRWLMVLLLSWAGMEWIARRREGLP